MKMGLGIEDLEQLKRLPEYRRRQWWDEILRIEEEYYGRYYREGERNEYLEANISLAKLKLVVSFLDNGERCPEHKFKEYEMEFLRGFEELVVIGRLSVDELVDYFKRVKGKERGLVKIAFDAVNSGYNVIDEIVRGRDIPGDLANAFKRVYGERVKKMEETARRYIEKYGLPAVEEDISSILEESEKNRAEVEHRIREDIEKRLSEFDEAFSSLDTDKTRLERRVLELERELSLSSVALKQLEEEKDTVRMEYETRISEHASILVRLKDELRSLEEAKERLQKATVEREEDKRRVEEELSKITELSESVRNEVEELKSENADLRRRREEMDALIESLSEEDVFFDGIRKEEARLREMDYVKRVEERLKEMPLDGGRWRKIEVFNEGSRIYDDLRKIEERVSYDALNEIPNGLSIRAVKGIWSKEIFEVKILSHYKEFFLNGFDRRKVSLKEVMPYIEELRVKAGHVLALASLTGWSAEAREYVERRR